MPGKSSSKICAKDPSCCPGCKKSSLTAVIGVNWRIWVNQDLHVVLEIVLKLGDKKGFQVLPKRWVIERTNAWITRQRRLARDYERRCVNL